MGPETSIFIFNAFKVLHQFPSIDEEKIVVVSVYIFLMEFYAECLYNKRGSMMF